LIGKIIVTLQKEKTHPSDRGRQSQQNNLRPSNL